MNKKYSMFIQWSISQAWECSSTYYSEGKLEMLSRVKEVRHRIPYRVIPRVHDVRGDMESHTMLFHVYMMSMAGRSTETESCKEEQGMGFVLAEQKCCRIG